MLVRATRQGYYDHVRRRVGDVFRLKEFTGLDRDGKHKVFTVEQQFSKLWMEKVEDEIELPKPERAGSKTGRRAVHSEEQVI